MRPIILATVPLIAALAVSSASAQINAQVRFGIPIGRSHVAISYRTAPMPRQVVVYDYDRHSYGDWARDRDYRRWQPVTVYFYAGRYYERPFRYARPVVIYRYRDRYFYPPRDARWERQYGRNNDWGRRDDRDRDDRYGRDRDDRYNDRGERHQNDRVVPPFRGGRSRP